MDTLKEQQVVKKSLLSIIDCSFPVLSGLLLSQSIPCRYIKKFSIVNFSFRLSIFAISPYFELKNGKTFSLSELQKMVGGYIEIIPFQNQVMVVNEEGKINGSKLNEEASVIFSNTYGHIDAIYGNVIMCSSELIN